MTIEGMFLGLCKQAMMHLATPSPLGREHLCRSSGSVVFSDPMLFTEPG